MTSQVDVTVTPLKRKGNELYCAIEGPHVKGGVLELDKASKHTLTFELAPGTGLKFVDPQDKPFCSDANNCPGKNDQDPQFSGIAVSNGGQTLTVNADAGTQDVVHYALRVTDGTGTLTCDPIIIND